MRVCSLFSGIGGIDLAFQQAGFEIVWANEFDRDAAKTYRYNFGGDCLVEQDIRSIRTEEISDFDVLVAGFPCQPFSSVGFQKGFKDPRGMLFFEIGYDQGQAVSEMMQKAGFKDINVAKDFAGLDRVVYGSC